MFAQPLTTLQPGEGATEFVLGSHHTNLSAMGLTTVKAIDEWAEKQPKLEAVMRAGSVAVFDGYVLHRGSPIRSCRRCGATSDDDAGDAAQVQQQTRDVLYWGCESDSAH